MDPHDVAIAALKVVELRARQKDLGLFCHVAASVPHNLVGDPLRLRQVLINLLGNAIKFTEKGQVSLIVTLEEAGREPVAAFRGRRHRNRHFEG